MTTPDLGVDLGGLLLAGRSVTAEIRQAITGATLSRTIEGPSTLDLGVHDRDRTLIRSRLLSERTVATLDKAVFELVKVRKAGSGVTVVFEDAVVADLRRKRGQGAPSAKAGTTTIDAFARRLVAAAPGAKLVAFGGQRNLDQLAVGRAGADGESEDYWTALQRLAEERGWRCFTDRGTVYLGPDSWLATRVPPVFIAEHASGVEDIDWDCDAGKKAPRATFVANISRWSAPPGAPVEVQFQGLGSGRWLVEEVNRSLFAVQGTITLVRQQPVIPEPKPEPRDDGEPTSVAVAASGGSTTAGPVSARGFSWPLTGTFTSGYGQRNGRLHAGQDIAVPIGTPVRAAKDGTVVFAGEASGYGIAVYVEHDGGVVTRYAHLSRLDVRRGQQVRRGQRIAASGNTGRSTGPHLHFELRVADRAVDPLPYLPSRR